MDDTCVVCADTLEWVAYGPCGHREVCSTCIARLRFICDDRRCCLCKSESKIVFMTKALGDYTRIINEFSIFQDDPTEGKVGPYWYHEGTRAYFDDLDHYKMIKAMCKLSCSACDKTDEQVKGRSRRRGGLKNIEQLKSHLLHQHKLSMCYLCLEGRKIFICEQKLYTRAQLNQHINTGDSEVDGSESERGGFSGHPLCEFCRNPFYGDNELYLHMSTEHYTCHICQRQHPGQYEYYKNYEDLEIHFRGEHYLCEDEGCLANKFVVFATESEMKRHNAKEHGGNMSRSKRNAALQIPTNFRYQQSIEEGHHGRRRGFRFNSVDNQLSMAIQASLETVNSGLPRGTSSNAQVLSNHQEMRDFESAVSSFDSLATTSNNSRNAPPEQSSFPPLPVAKKGSRNKSRNGSKRSGGNTMATHLHSQNNGTVGVGSSSQASSTRIRQTISSVDNFSQSRPISNSGVASSSGSSSSLQNKPAEVLLVPSTYASSSQARQVTGHGLLLASPASSSRNSSGSGKVSHSSSAPNLVEQRCLDSNICSSPSVSAIQPDILPPSSQPLLKVRDAPCANKSLVERIRSALEFDDDRYLAFKEMSKEYRRGLVDTGEYLGYVHQFGLSHLVLDLASLCPDAQKQKELVETYNFNMGCNNGPHNDSSSSDSSLRKDKKGKEKCQDNGISSSKDGSSGNNLRKLQPKLKQLEEVEVLLKDGYQSAKGKAKIIVLDEQTDFDSTNQPVMELRSENDSQPEDGGSKKPSGTGGGGKKQRKKTSKFDRLRLGDNSAATLASNSDRAPDSSDKRRDKKNDSSQSLLVRGVWKNGGGQRLVANWS